MDWKDVATPEEISALLRNTGKQRYEYVTKGGKIILVHDLIWIEQFGEIPKGMIIHHKDENKLNNKIENLQLVSHKEHRKIHKRKITPLTENLIPNNFGGTPKNIRLNENLIPNN